MDNTHFNYRKISVNQYKEYSFLRLSELEELSCFGV